MRMRMPIALATVLSAVILCAADEPKPAPNQPEQQEYEKLGAFERVSWKGDDFSSPEVELGGIKYEVKELQDLPVKQVLDFCRKKDPAKWREVFEEDLVEVLSKMGKPPEGTLKVKLHPTEGGEDRTFEAVWLTTANLEMIVKNRQVVPAAVPGAPAGAAAGAVAPPPAGPVKRVERPHAKAIAEEFKSLTDRIEPRSVRGKEPLSTKQAEEDLDQLEWLLVNRYAYLERSKLDYKMALDTIRAGVADGIPRGAFALQVHQFLALFGDGHTGASLELQDDLPDAYLPFLLSQIAGGRPVAYDPGGAGLVDLDRPVVIKLDGVDVEKWIDAARSIAPGGSPHFVRRFCVEQGLRHVNHLRTRLGLPRKDAIVVSLSSLDGKNAGSLEMKLVDEPVTRPLPREGLRRTLEGNIGYLRIASMTDDPNFLKALHDAMAESRGTRGLIMDVRGNGGGSRAILRELFPYFMDGQADKPCVVNVAAYRLNADKNEAADAKEGYLADRYLWPGSSAVWSDDERATIEQFAKGFQPEWRPPAGEFSAWHAMVLSPAKGGLYFHYDKPVVILMDAGCFSATDIFLGAFKGWKNVTLLGTPSGGGSGRPEGFRLAHSGVGVRLSSMASYRADGTLYDGRGVAPDVDVWPEPNDFIGRTDSVLEKAVKRVKGE